MTEEEKNQRQEAIKKYWNAAKQKCPFSDETLQNGYLEGFIEGAAEATKVRWHDLRKDPKDLPELGELPYGSWYTKLVLCFEYREDDHGKKAKVYSLDRYGPEPYKWENNPHGWDAWCELPEPPEMTGGIK